MSINIDKSKWTKAKFGEVAIQLKGNVDRNNTKLRYYVKGEHMSTEDLHIRKCGELKDEYLGPAFIRHFIEGDILYGSRRTYLKKVAVAKFEGITSNTTFVLNAIDKKFDKRLLPFLMLSDGFTSHSIMNSKGSVNPYINWKDLANYEFLLPPKEQQAELADLLWAMDEVIEKDLRLLEQLEKLLENFIVNKIFDNNLKDETINSILVQVEKKVGLESLKNVGIFLKGKGIPKDVVVENGTPCIRYGEIYTTHQNIIRNFKSFIPDNEKANSFKLEKGDIIFAGSGEKITEIAKSVGFIDKFEAYAGGDTIVLRPFSNYNSIFLSYLLNSILVRLQLNKIGTGATVAHIYTEDLKKIKLPKLDLKEQNDMAEYLENIYKNKANLFLKIQSSKALQKALINQVF